MEYLQKKDEKQDITPILSKIMDLQASLNKSIIGQENLVHKLIVALLSDGHVLVEGPPGIAKTTAIQNLARSIHADFKRIQFTPDLLPADLTGSDMYKVDDGSFEFKAGPIFNQIILADEINRAPAKVQSALLEAMSEKQVSVGNNSYDLPSLFMVMATQNPLDQQGTYPLPEAQLDRFLFKIQVSYPNVENEIKILDLIDKQKITPQKPIDDTAISINNTDILSARQYINKVHLSDIVKEYIVQLTAATRNPKFYDAELSKFITFGASPRASLALASSARAHAWLRGSNYVTPEDVQHFFLDVMRHRIILSFEAQADNVDEDTILNKLLSLVPCG